MRAADHPSPMSFTTLLNGAATKLSRQVSTRRKSIDDGKPPSVKHLLKNRQEVMTKYQGNRALKFRAGSTGDTPLASLGRLYQFFVVGWRTQARSELEYFWNQTDPAWAMAQIPDPQDHRDSIRYGIFVVLVRLMTKDFNTLIQMGYRRGIPFIQSAQAEVQKTDTAELETVPEWVQSFDRVAGDKNEWVVIPDTTGYPEVNSRGLSEEFREVGILVREPPFRMKAA